MSEVILQVPIADAVEWEPWLTDELSIEAEKLDMGYDGGEESGAWEEHLFFAADAERVRRAAEAVLRRHREPRSVTVPAPRRVRVEQDPASGGAWLNVRTTPDPYGRAMKNLVKRLNDDAALRDWARADGIGRVLVQESPTPGAPVYVEKGPADGHRDDVFMVVPVDLSIYDRDDGRSVRRDDAVAAARRNVQVILRAIAGVIGSEPPSVADVDG